MYSVIESVSPNYKKMISKLEYMLYMSIVLRAHQFSAGGRSVHSRFFEFDQVIGILKVAAGLEYPKCFDSYFKCLGRVEDPSGHEFITRVNSKENKLSICPEILVKLLKSVYYSHNPPQPEEGVPLVDEKTGFENYKKQLLKENKSWTWLKSVSLSDNSCWNKELYKSEYSFENENEKYLFIDSSLTFKINIHNKYLAKNIELTGVKRFPYQMEKSASNKAALLQVTEDGRDVCIKAAFKFSSTLAVLAIAYKFRTPWSEIYEEYPLSDRNYLTHTRELCYDRSFLLYRICNTSLIDSE